MCCSKPGVHQQTPQQLSPSALQQRAQQLANMALEAVHPRTITMRAEMWAWLRQTAKVTAHLQAQSQAATQTATRGATIHSLAKATLTLTLVTEVRSLPLTV